jgi:uncharacterized protein (UPF0147 family)
MSFTNDRVSEIRTLLEAVADRGLARPERFEAVRRFQKQFSIERDIEVLETILLIQDVPLVTKAFILNILGNIGNDDAFDILKRLIDDDGVPDELKLGAYRVMLRLNEKVTRQIVGRTWLDWLPKPCFPREAGPRLPN